MKSKLLTVMLTCACVSLARADFNPVTLTANSYNFDIVVEASATYGLPECINVTAGNGASKGDNTYYEQGLYNRPGLTGANSGIPPHNTVFTNINNANMSFLMPPDYTVNNEIMTDTSFSLSGTMTFSTPTTATNLAILNAGGGGTVSVAYVVTHADSTTENGTLNLLDWFNGGSTVAWGANGRVSNGGSYNNFNSSTVNNNPPYLYANTIAVSSNSPIVSITLTYSSGQHGNFFAVSGCYTNTTYSPIPLDPGSFNARGIVPVIVGSFPVTATMDQGTNLAENGNLATWFEQGFDRSNPGDGLPPSGSTFDSVSQPTHHYKFASYTANNAILIDTNHQTANITPAVPASYSTFALLTAGGNVGSVPMTNLCILQHADGVNETNLFLGYDWFDQNHNGAIALQANGRVNMAARSVNAEGSPYFPFLFETYFSVVDTGSPVTNIVVQYVHASSSSATTYVMALSAASGGVPPVVSSGPLPSSQTLLLGTNATFTVGVVGTAPIGGYWQVSNTVTAAFQNLSDGLDANGSIISGSHTFTLTISNIFLPDANAYQFVATNAFGTSISPVGVLVLNPQTNTITPSPAVFYTSNNIPLTVHVSAGPAVKLQWFYVDNSGNTNNIPGATNTTYTILNAQLSLNGTVYGVTASNVYGTNTSSVMLTISDSQAFLVSDLAPAYGEAYAGAPITYVANVAGNSPISYQWIVNGSVVNGANSNSYTIATPCGLTTIQASFSNLLSGAVATTTSQVTIKGDPNPTNLTFNVSGIGWQTNGSVPLITSNVLRLTDGNGGEASSAFYTNAIYVGGAWTAKFTYNSHGGGADGAAFVLQTTNATALGGGGGQLGYTGIAGPSLAFQINLYGGNSETPGIALVTGGTSGTYQSAAPVSTTTTNDIYVVLNWANGVLSASLTDSMTGTNYSTNYIVGPITSVLGSSFAYVGFTGADGGVTSLQTVSNFQFHTILPPVALVVSPLTGNTFTISWSAADPTYVLQTTSTLTPTAWVAGPSPTLVNGTNNVTVNVNSGSPRQFYRLVRVACQ